MPVAKLISNTVTGDRRGDPPAESVSAKIADRVNEVTRRFIDASPFVCVATSRPDGGLDVSPKGDPAGFVHVLDDRTLLIPDPPRNKNKDNIHTPTRPRPRTPR